MSDWTDELKAEVEARYLAAEPTPENSMDIVTEIAEELEKSPNGVRAILSKAGVYVKKVAVKSASPAAKTATADGETKGTRVVKATAIADLCAAIKDAGQVVDDAIVQRMTGKAAVYFTEVIKATLSKE
jgi:hypothetical protein